MNNDSYIYILTALLPLAACMVVIQANPYHALVIRGILGAIAALIYSVFGAADVALTEALMGTMLAITLYAVAVRSSLVMRLGVLEEEKVESDGDVLKVELKVESPRDFNSLMKDFRRIFSKYYLRIEVVPFTSVEALHRALMEKEIHASCVPVLSNAAGDAETKHYQTVTRIQRLYDIMQPEIASINTSLDYKIASGLGEDFQ
jgi:putative multicomponent Na+:H+ antiporter subunit B